MAGKGRSRKTKRTGASKQAAKASAAVAKRKKQPQKAAQKVSISTKAKSIHIKFVKPEHVIPHLLSLASDIAGKHFESAAFTSAADDVLGTEAARDIVATCANSRCWNCTLAELQLDSMLFQGCVYNGVLSAGYDIDKNNIPSSQDTQLYTVVMAIQGAKKK